MTERNQLHLVGIFAGISGFIFFWSQIFVWFAAPSHQTLPFGHAPAHDPALAGIFYGVEPQKDELDSEVRFYYFHGNGIGLLRYGKVGLNNTESFHYQTHEGVLSIRYNKTGQMFTTSYAFEKENDRQVLVLPELTHKDDRRLVKEEGSEMGLLNQPSGIQMDRMWTMLEKHAGGGIDFKIYQLRKADDTGHGEGFFHEGDFDNWSTERLNYHIGDGQMTFHFSLKDEKAQTSFQLERPHDLPMLVFDKDPRHFWATTHYWDGGESFSLFQTAALHDMVLHGGYF